MRLFIAIALPAPLRAAIGEAVKTVRGASASPQKRGHETIRWIPEESIHLTLKFLGEVSGEQAAAVQASLAPLCAAHRPFGLTIAGSGAFPTAKSPNILWVGVARSEALLKLAREIDRAMAALGFEEEGRPFSPHLTIGRVKERRAGAAAAKELSTFRDRVFGSIEVNRILLMESRLKPGGAEYTARAGFTLNKEAPTNE